MFLYSLTILPGPAMIKLICKLQLPINTLFHVIVILFNWFTNFGSYIRHATQNMFFFSLVKMYLLAFCLLHFIQLALTVYFSTAKLNWTKENNVTAIQQYSLTYLMYLTHFLIYLTHATDKQQSVNSSVLVNST